VIRRNLLEDIGGDGIKPWGCAGALVEHNRLRGGQMRCNDYAAGIWPWDCDDTVVQFNEVSGMRGDRDGEAFDSDGLCRRSLFQYNYSHDNEGGFMLVCATPAYHCEGTVIRYNISRNDGIKSARVFHLGGPVRNTRIYNNTIYVGPGQDLPLLNFTEDEGWPEGTRFTNNLFLIAGRPPGGRRLPARQSRNRRRGFRQPGRIPAEGRSEAGGSRDSRRRAARLLREPASPGRTAVDRRGPGAAGPLTPKDRAGAPGGSGLGCGEVETQGLAHLHPALPHDRSAPTSGIAWGR